MTAPWVVACAEQTGRRMIAACMAVVLGLLGPPQLLAQAHAIRFERLSTEDGLSNSWVTAITQDQRGFMWFATQDGLNRFDGYRFTVFQHDPAEATSLSDNYVHALHVDRAGVLWVGTEDGLSRFDCETETFTHYRHNPANPNTLPGAAVGALYEDHVGALWVGTRDGLSRFDRKAGTFTHYRHDAADASSLSHNNVLALYEDKAGTLWVGTAGGLSRFDRATETFTRYRHDPANPNSLGNDFVLALYEDQEDAFWVGTHGGGLSRFDREAGTFAHYRHDPADSRSLGHNVVLSIYEDRAGMLWVGTAGGLSRFDRATETFTRYRHDPANPNSLSKDGVVALYQDRAGVLWAGALNGGLNRFDPFTEVFRHYRHNPAVPTSLSNDLVLSLYEDRAGMLWIGTRNGGLNRFDREAGTFAHFLHNPADPASLSHNRVWALYEDRAGTLWAGTAGGLSRFDRATETFTRYRHDPADPNSLSHNFVIAMHEDQAGRFWVATWGGGLNRFDREAGTFTRYRHDPANPTSLNEDRISTIYEDASGTLWLATEGGLGRLITDPASGTVRFDRYQHNPDDASSLSDNRVEGLYEDASGTLWVGTAGGGLNALNPVTETFCRYTTRDGLPSNTLFGILPDDDGQLWISTTNGLARFDPAAGSFRNYDAADGLQGNAFNSRAFFKNSRGELFFGGQNGFTVFLPAEVRSQAVAPPVVLTSFKIMNEEVLIDRHLATVEALGLTYEDKVLSFEFAALDYAAPHKNQYAYWLKGFDDGWVDLGTKRDVTFTNLDPGSYTLHVRGSNNHGVWSREGLAVRLHVTPPLWGTWWFRLLSGLAAVVGLIGGYQRRTRTIRRRNQVLQKEVTERRRVEAQLEVKNAELAAKNEELAARNAEMERFTYTVSHDLKTPLVTIKGFLGLLRQDLALGNTDALDKDLGHISSAADTMGRLLGELLELSRIGRKMNPPEAVGLSDLAREAAALAAGPIKAGGVLVQIDMTMPVVYGDRVRLLEVFQNLIDNAVKFMGDQPAPHIEVGACRAGDEVICFVRDNGIGIPQRYHNKVFGLFDQLNPNGEGTGIGLALVKRIVEVHEGRIWVESAGDGCGATIFFTLPAMQEAVEGALVLQD